MKTRIASLAMLATSVAALSAGSASADQAARPKSVVDFTSGGQDLGKTQYIDAYQRGNFWGANVQQNTNYHVVLGSPTVLKPLKITVQSGQGLVEKNPFGPSQIGTYGFNLMDQQ